MWIVKVPHIVYEEVLISEQNAKTEEDAIYYVIEGREPLYAGPEDLSSDAIVEWSNRIASDKDFLVTREVSEFD